MTRTILPARRPHQTVQFEHWGQHYSVGIGVIDGVPREVFLDCSKSGWDAETLAKDSAVLLSIALQHGVPISEMRHAIARNFDGSPAGPIGRVLDLLATDKPRPPPPDPLLTRPKPPSPPTPEGQQGEVAHEQATVE